MADEDIAVVMHPDQIKYGKDLTKKDPASIDYSTILSCSSSHKNLLQLLLYQTYIHEKNTAIMYRLLLCYCCCRSGNAADSIQH